MMDVLTSLIWALRALATSRAQLAAENLALRQQLLERFHSTLKSEEVYWRLYDHPQHCRACLAEFRERYNMRRPHWALVPEVGGDPLVPLEVYAEGKTIQIPRWQKWAIAAKAKLEELLDKAVA